MLKQKGENILTLSFSKVGNYKRWKSRVSVGKVAPRIFSLVLARLRLDVDFHNYGT